MKQLIFKDKTLIWTEKLLLISFLIFPFLWGVFYNSIACFAGIFFCVLLVGHVRHTKKLILGNGIKTVSFFGILAGYVIACFFAIDKGMAWLGIGKIAAITIFYILSLQLRKEVLEMCMQTISHMGTIMVLLCIVAYFIPNIKGFFFQARRMGGFFQYSNIFAFFLLIGIVLILTKDIYKKADIAKVMILLLGLLWSGSRSVFLLFGIAILVLMWKKSAYRKQLLGIGVTTITVVVIYTMITKDVQNIGRIFTASLESSTLLGRILYNIDAIKILMQHPIGLGSLGYSYIQLAEQTGVYTTMFVHNDVLQIGLDGGILAMISFSIWIFSNVFTGNIRKRNQGILALFLLHLLVDFDLQYAYLFFVLILVVNSGQSQIERGILLNRQRIRKAVFSWVISMCSILFLYVGIANRAEEIGNHKVAVKIYPWNTESLTNLMLSYTTIEEVEQYADRILKQNKYSYAAYNMKAIAALEQGDYKNMIAYKKKALAITKYDIAEYQDYIVMLKKSIDDSIDRNDVEDYQTYITDLLAIPMQLEAVKKNTHWLAWKLRDTPDLTLEQEYMDYIEWYRRLEDG